MTQRLLFAALSVVAGIVFAAGPAFAPPAPYQAMNAAPTAVVGSSAVHDSFNELASLDTKQVVRAESERCAAFYYYAEAETLYCISPDGEWTAE